MQKQASRQNGSNHSQMDGGGAGISTAAAGFVGAVAGAAVGIALSNKDTREQIARFVRDARDKSLELKDRVQEEAGSMKETASELLSQTQEMMEERDNKSRTENLKGSRNSK